MPESTRGGPGSRSLPMRSGTIPARPARSGGGSPGRSILAFPESVASIGGLSLMADLVIDPYVDLYADRMSGMSASEVRALFAVASRPEVVSLAGGMPFVSALPGEDVEDVVLGVLRDHGSSALQYCGGIGLPGVRDRLVELMAEEGVEASAERVVVTNGAQQALDLIGKIFVDAGDEVVVEEPSYVGAISAFSAYEPRFVQIPLDDEGMVVSELEEALRGGVRPKFVYTIPNFSNPAGVTMSLPRRERLVEVCRAGNPRGVGPCRTGDPRPPGAGEGGGRPLLQRADAVRRRAVPGRRPVAGQPGDAGGRLPDTARRHAGLAGARVPRGRPLDLAPRRVLRVGNHAGDRHPQPPHRGGRSQGGVRPRHGVLPGRSRSRPHAPVVLLPARRRNPRRRPPPGRAPHRTRRSPPPPPHADRPRPQHRVHE